MLGQYLSDNGTGEWTYLAGIRDGLTHAWLERDEIYADITADQFEDVEQEIIVTMGHAWHTDFSSIAGDLIQV
jgi:hypothetical protein